MNKKAVEINITTIIVVILAILVLVVLALYFTGGMRTLWGKITPVPGAYEQTDVEQARNACTLYCGARDQTSYCTHKFDIRTVSEGKVTGTTQKFCDDSVIGAASQEDCKGVGYDKIKCDDLFPNRAT
jgi:hypothetical protein